MKLDKPKCFTDAQWKIYSMDLTAVGSFRDAIRNGKTLDICADCTVEHQRKMRIADKCSFPMKRIDSVVEYV